MTVLYKYGALLYWSPVRDVLQRWRLSLASLLIFTILLADNLGLSLGMAGKFSATMKYTGLASSPGRTGNISLSMFLHKRDIHSLEAECLVLDGELTNNICKDPVDKRWEKIRQGVYLKFCNVKLFNALDPDCYVTLENKGNEKRCIECLRKIECKDQQVKEFYKNFEEILSRYDCSCNFSVNWTCAHCKRAYKSWLCASEIPYYLRNNALPKSSTGSQTDTLVKPCRHVCNNITQRCPYMLPHIDSQYAGEPTFVCTDSSYDHGNSTDVADNVCLEPCEGFNQNNTELCEKHFVGARTSNSTASGAPRGQWRVGVLSTVIAQLTILWHTRTIQHHRVIGLT